MNDEMNGSQQNSEQELPNQGHDELQACKSERDSWKEKFLRVQADYDNFTKRNDKERLQWRNTVQANLLLDILPIIDDFDRAFEQKNELNEHMINWMTGFEMIRKEMYKFLEKHQVNQIPATLPFDPEYHEAIMQVESPDHTAGQIVGILQKGYTFRDQVLRPAKVSVAK